MCCVRMTDMQASMLTWALNRVDVMTWNHWAMYCCISSVIHCLGRASRQPPRSRSTIVSARKSCLPQLTTSARVSRPSLQHISTTAVGCVLTRRPTTCTCGRCSEYCFAHETTTMTMCLTGPCCDRSQTTASNLRV